MSKFYILLVYRCMCTQSSYHVDTQNPVAKITATTKQNTITINASGSSDSESGIKNYQYSRDNKTWYTSTANTYTFTGLADGSYTIYVEVTDNAGRTAMTSTTVTVAYTTVYVSATGNNSTANGSYNNPFSSLQTAYENVQNNGYIVLLSNLTMNYTADFYIQNKSVVLKSADNAIYSLIRDANSPNRTLLKIENQSTASLTNIILDGKNISSSESLLTIATNATVYLNEKATIQNALGTNDLGGIVINQATLNINGALIKNNTAQYSGSAIRSYRATVNLNSGSIEYNKTTNSTRGGDGAIYMWGGTFTMSDGSISNNSSAYSGGAFFISCDTYEQSITINGGSIINNYAYQSNGGAGGGLYVDCYTSGQASLKITSGTITGNSRYGVVYHGSKVTYSKTGGNVASNTPDNILRW